MPLYFPRNAEEEEYATKALPEDIGKSGGLQGWSGMGRERGRDVREVNEGGRNVSKEMREGERGRERGRDMREVNEGRGKVTKGYISIWVSVLVKCVS